MLTPLSLNGTWKLTSDQIDIPAQIPGDVYSALLDSGIIPDPYYGQNETVIQEYRKRHWTYQREFTVQEELLKKDHVYLVLSSVDTFFSCEINGKEVCRGSNQFTIYRPDVRKALKAGNNTIAFHFDPMEIHSTERWNANHVGLTGIVGTVPHINQVRKTACHGGWDWGITLLVSGIYDDVMLYAADNARIDYLYTEQTHHDDGAVTLKAIAEITAESAAETPVVFTFDGQKKTVNAQLNAGENKVTAVFEVPSPKLWWPSGYGEQPLYTLTVEADTQVKRCQVGLRKLEAVSQKDQWGCAFLFRVNGQDIFAKGGDWIPCDALPQRQTPEKYMNLLSSIRAANMNMVRVWGGGQYEHDCFYDYCDQMGILVWQDMMFSCDVYPSDKQFQAEFREEIAHQIRRLRSHASIALWCGDNECLGATRWDGPEKQLMWTLQFDRNNRIIGDVVQANDNERIFWPSSPCAGPGELTDNWTDDSCGDMHYWQVWHGSKPFEAYYDVIPRFCSEFGYEAYPSLELIDSFCPPEEQNVFSPIMDHRQKCRKGNAPILAMFERYFRFPVGFRNFLYLSQLQQALAIKTGVEFWRTLRPRCMGTLFWQINDDWPTISWASIEYGGKWKQLHYHARRFYAPILVTLIRRKDKAPELYAVSDLAEDSTVKVTVTAWRFDGTIAGKQVISASLAAGQSLWLTDYDESTLTQGADDSNLILEYVAIATTADGRTFTARNASFRARYKELNLQEPGLKAEFAENQVTLSCEKPAVFVALDTTGVKGFFDDNSFCLFPGEARVIRFNGSETLTAEQLKKATTIQHLRGSYCD